MSQFGHSHSAPDLCLFKSVRSRQFERLLLWLKLNAHFASWNLLLKNEQMQILFELDHVNNNCCILAQHDNQNWYFKRVGNVFNRLVYNLLHYFFERSVDQVHFWSVFTSNEVVFCMWLRKWKWFGAFCQLSDSLLSFYRTEQ